jgi:aryl-alcohol dehydrogenase-like predicted oxidoreductase
LQQGNYYYYTKSKREKREMDKHRLGWTDLELSAIGLGTWALGGAGWKFNWGPQDDRDSIDTIHRAYDLGVNWLDTAALYGFGHSEEVVGQALKTMHEKPLVATKCSRVWNAEGSIQDSLKRESLRRELEASLKRLQLERIDLYQIHWPRPDEHIEEGWQTLDDLRREGKIRYIGVCNFDRSQLERIQAIAPVASLQPPYSMLRRDIEQETLPFCAAHNIGVVPYSPMQKGILTDAFSLERVANLQPGDHRLNDPQFKAPALEAHLKLVDSLRLIAREKRCSVAQLAIAWVLRRPEVTSAIVGARRPAQIEETVGAGEVQLSAEDIRHIEDLLAQRSLV